MWEKLTDLKDGIFYVDLARDCKVFYRPAIESELGDYVHIRSYTGKIIHSSHFKNKTISISSMPSLVMPTSVGMFQFQVLLEIESRVYFINVFVEY